MTLAEAARKIVEQWRADDGIDIGILESALARESEKTGETRWISVGQKLPNHCQIVWVNARSFGEQTVHMIAGYFKDVGFRSDGFDLSVTHWMPLPDPPTIISEHTKEDKDEQH